MGTRQCSAEASGSSGWGKFVRAAFWAKFVSDYGPPFLMGLGSRLFLFVVLNWQNKIPYGIGREAPRFFKYDAVWHWDIMEHGYAGANHGNYIVSHFSIVWPAILKAFSWVAGDNKVAYIYLNCVIFGMAAAAVARLARSCHVSWVKAVVFLCCFPTAYFANTIYNDPLFLLVTVISAALVLDRKQASAGFWAAAGLALRVNAWAQIAAWAASLPRTKIGMRAVVFGAVFIVLFGSIQYVFNWAWRGDPFAHYKDFKNAAWMANPQIVPFKEPAETLYTLARNPRRILYDDYFAYARVCSAGALLFGLVVLGAGWRGMPKSIKIQGALTILGLSLLQDGISIPRYMMSFLPFYFCAGRWPPWVLGGVCVFMAWGQYHMVSRFIVSSWAF